MRWNVLTPALVILLAVAATDRVQGSIITYTISGIGSGTIGATSFTDQPFSIIATANTDNVQPTGGGRFAVNNNSVVVQLGATTYAGTSPGSSYIAIPSITIIPPAFAYSQLNVGDFIDTFNLGVGSFDFTGYDLQAPLGPVAVEAFTAYTGDFFGLPTSAGFFVLNHQTSSPEMTFQATVAAVPEPSMFVVAALLSMSGAAMVCQQRVRERRSA